MEDRIRSVHCGCCKWEEKLDKKRRVILKLVEIKLSIIFE